MTRVVGAVEGRLSVWGGGVTGAEGGEPADRSNEVLTLVSMSSSISVKVLSLAFRSESYRLTIRFDRNCKQSVSAILE